MTLKKVSAAPLRLAQSTPLTIRCRALLTLKISKVRPRHGTTRFVVCRLSGLWSWGGHLGLPGRPLSRIFWLSGQLAWVVAL